MQVRTVTHMKISDNTHSPNEGRAQFDERTPFAREGTYLLCRLTACGVKHLNRRLVVSNVESSRLRRASSSNVTQLPPLLAYYLADSPTNNYSYLY